MQFGELGICQQIGRIGDDLLHEFVDFRPLGRFAASGSPGLSPGGGSVPPGRCFIVVAAGVKPAGLHRLINLQPRDRTVGFFFHRVIAFGFGQSANL